jgi:hypothetical protein
MSVDKLKYMIYQSKQVIVQFNLFINVSKKLDLFFMKQLQGMLKKVHYHVTLKKHESGRGK